MAKAYANLDRSIQNSVRVTGLIFLPALVALNIGLLLDEERRNSPTDGRFIYALGLPGWIVDGAMAVFFATCTILIIVSWIRSARKTRAQRRSDPTDGDRSGGS